VEVLRHPAALRAWADAQIASKARIGLVPTMGFLHRGHLSLVEEAKKRADRVVATIFVNPTQFGPQEDLARYPRDLEGDLEKLRSAGTHAVFVPEVAAMYPAGFDTYVTPTTLAEVLCGASRPGHFRGVCTVVHLLFSMSRAHVALFGEKDFQQLTIIRRMVRDLWLDVEVVGMPIVREPDGLAMSSRNKYLSPQERQSALALSRALDDVERAVNAGERTVERLTRLAQQAIGAHARIDYVSIVDPETLRPLTTLDQPAVCAVAAFVGKTRLIDNRRLSFDPPRARVS
jgi:pantoate--beta-alanine ligase